MRKLTLTEKLLVFFIMAITMGCLIGSMVHLFVEGGFVWGIFLAVTAMADGYLFYKIAKYLDM